ncbi:hypothetical protein LX16_1282 [Stackebrandtia albiflava]|uniref:Uncharacterized protein n=1 Tax=Stackebrandtia albiflava TaxID=406432 RepID=A0A562VCN1_9ACTN|nr:hypothetical protein [Stackebrandtia albiflava]TWJ15571.1 hypothetical protein LX16_1282 [Stackebrandtia albiflava]
MTSIEDYVATIDNALKAVEATRFSLAAARRTGDSTSETLHGITAFGAVKTIDTANSRLADAVNGLALVAAAAAEARSIAISAQGLTAVPPTVTVVPPIRAATAVPRDVRRPHRRHTLAKIQPKDAPKRHNTVILPGVDVDSDMARIRDGESEWDAQSRTHTVNGRRYGTKDGGRTFPVDGPGLQPMSRPEYKALLIMIRHRGDLAEAERRADFEPGITGSDWDAALRVFRRHPDFRR